MPCLLPKVKLPSSRLAALDLLIAVVLLLLTSLLYSRTAQNDFMRMDDGCYFAQNPHIKAGISLHSLRWALMTFQCANWHPLTWISLEIDCQLFGDGPVGPHLMNAGFHAINTSLLFVMLSLATARRWSSAICAALFGWHPLRVESVAWIAERKDVLSVLFFLLTLLAYLHYVKRPAARTYGIVFLFLTLGLLAKPMLVMAPALLLLLDYWPLGRLRDAATLRMLVIEKIPIFLLSLASAIVTIKAQHAGGAVVQIAGRFTLYRRLENAACSVIGYMTKLLCPVKLAPYYPFPAQQFAWQFAGALFLLILITLICILARRIRPYLLVGWLWFIASLLPVIGLLQVGEQAMADRYSYIPSIGLLMAIIWLATDWYDRQSSVRPSLIAICASAVLTLLALTYRQIGLWKDDFTLFSYTCSVTQQNWMAEGNLAQALADRGDLEDAEIHLRKSLSIHPDKDAVMDLASLQRLKQKRLPGEAEYARQIRANPSDPIPHYNWGNLLLRAGRGEDAAIHYSLYLQARPNDARAHTDLGIALAQTDRLADAQREFEEAIKIDPNYADAICDLGMVLLSQAKFAEAAANFEQALRLDPGMQRAKIGLDQALSKL